MDKPALNPPKVNTEPVEVLTLSVSVCTCCWPFMSNVNRSTVDTPPDAVVAQVILPPMLLLATGVPVFSTLVRI